MFSWDNPEDRVAVVQMNAELRHARLELLSAECATHQLRLRFSVEDLARYGEQDLLRKAIDSAAALNDFYASIEKQIPKAGQPSPTDAAGLTEEQAHEIGSSIASYIEEQRNRHFPSGTPLSAQLKSVMQPFFSASLLGHVRMAELRGEGLPDPPFYVKARELGLVYLPSFAEMKSLTFLDVVVSKQRISDSDLFHALVHAVQFQILGLQRYVKLMVRGLLRTQAHFAVPIEAHAFALTSRFDRDSTAGFSVEEQVRLWMKESRY
ncbi:MAG: hypothetical protein WB711_07770 [Terriglobales bacterium]